MNKTGNSDTIVGLDLGNCSLNHLDFALNLTESLNVIDISQNPLVDLSQEIFRGLSGLWYIAVPLNLSCPGGNDTWGNVTKTSSALICQDQNSACGTTGNLTLLCPESSMCAPDGPGYTKCVCAPGFTGYKCLREVVILCQFWLCCRVPFPC
ncbi:all-trans retinoic acid-induced differentiation factor [Pelobates cultripes]|uniref:All-trans retinoic acid-induced differentiation factor n=1 Tax=Pelobates cultripes TaxID=61616 RepID=A0AAD1R946_PELCU|nr:all-trans retinoic acid-induced differentiation factor [Pelobates cultripes]